MAASSRTDKCILDVGRAEHEKFRQQNWTYAGNIHINIITVYGAGGSYYNHHGMHYNNLIQVTMSTFE